jgi:hypothetical protein
MTFQQRTNILKKENEKKDIWRFAKKIQTLSHVQATC